jgi:hypothetical protein
MIVVLHPHLGGDFYNDIRSVHELFLHWYPANLHCRSGLFLLQYEFIFARYKRGFFTTVSTYFHLFWPYVEQVIECLQDLTLRVRYSISFFSSGSPRVEHACATRLYSSTHKSRSMRIHIQASWSQHLSRIDLFGRTFNKVSIRAASKYEQVQKRGATRARASCEERQGRGKSA